MTMAANDAVHQHVVPQRGLARVGCSGWSYRDWSGVIYPTGLPPNVYCYFNNDYDGLAVADAQWLRHVIVGAGQD